MMILKRVLKRPIVMLLAWGARLVILRYRPIVVMVTGSVGKTSAKDAIAAALSSHFYLYKSEKSYNSEFGVPFTIIGAGTPWMNPFAWAGVFKDLLALLILPNHYPKLLVLEVGGDRPGEIPRILKIATPHAVVVTRLPEIPVHVETYASPAAVREEEFLPAYALAQGAPLIIAADDPYACALAENLRAKVITYGFDEKADVRAEEPQVYTLRGKPAGMESEVRIGKGHRKVRVPGALGRQHLYAPLAAIALAEALSVPAKEAAEGLDEYVPPPGRERLLSGLKGTTLIDGSYNASPTAVEHALMGLSALPEAKRRIAVLGDMMELGRYSMAEHERIGALVKNHADLLVTVGIRARAMAEAAKVAGMGEEKITSFTTSIEAADALADTVVEGDAVLVKGSQAVRLERIVKRLLADSEDAQYLVRQEDEWQKIS